ncbi:MAG: pyridoxine 5'-phosphate oxidase C-terminal domain-containing protein [Legionellaceae bacterium]|nr:pyridoxine 5'-phosphate oxidase C-terminal domain-containing protein [Legionellaceae bacterium]
MLRPASWGGFTISPFVFEFWQGRDNRLHDRIQYQLSPQGWSLRCLAP